MFLEGRACNEYIVQQFFDTAVLNVTAGDPTRLAKAAGRHLRPKPVMLARGLTRRGWQKQLAGI